MAYSKQNKNKNFEPYVHFDKEDARIKVIRELGSLGLGTPVGKPEEHPIHYSVTSDGDGSVHQIKIIRSINSIRPPTKEIPNPNVITSNIYAKKGFRDTFKNLLDSGKLDNLGVNLKYAEFREQGFLEFELEKSTADQMYLMSIDIMDTINNLIDPENYPAVIKANPVVEVAELPILVGKGGKAIKSKQLSASSASAAPFVPSNGITFASVSAPKAATTASLITNRPGTPFAALFPSLITDSPSSSRPSTPEDASRVPAESNSDKLARLVSETEELSEEQKQIAEEQKQLAKQIDELSAKQIKNSGKIDFNNSEIASLKDVVKAEAEARNAALKKEKASRVAALKQQLLDAERELEADNAALLNETERAKQYSAKNGEGWHSEQPDDA